MKKLLLSLALVLGALSVSAQTAAFQPANGNFSVQREAAAIAPKAHKAPAKLSLAKNQRLAGYYVTDEAYSSGVGIGSYGAATIIPAALLEQDLDFAPYIGAKVVGVRFYLPQGTATGVVIYDASGESLTQLVEQDETVTTTGWNTVTLDESKQFTLTSDMLGLLVGTKITQQTNNYPIGVNPNITGRTMYIYCNISSTYGGSGWGWYNFGDDYALTIQLLLESDNFPTNGVMPTDFGKFTVALNGTREKTVSFFNAGESLTSFAYTLTQEGQTSEEKTVTLPATSQLGVGGSVDVAIPFPAASQTGTWPVTLNVTKVNGVANELTKTASGTNITLGKALHKASVVEQFTGVTCGYCPRGHVGMSKMRAQYGDQFVGVALHGYSGSATKDAMYNTNYPDLGFTGAPSCMINRSGSTMDPYAGSTGDIVDDFGATLEELPEVGVTTYGFWNDDSTKVDVTATFEPLVSGTYKTAYYLVADSLTGTTSAWKQYNYFSSQYASSTGYTKSYLETYYPDLAFLWDKGATYEETFNDVMIASSYSGTTNKASDVEFTENMNTTGTYTMSMPTRAALKAAINKDLVYAVVLVLDAESGEVINAAKGKIFSNDPTGINNTESTKTATVVARYNANGQMIATPAKGLNIVKMSDGTVRKIMVK